MRGQEIGERERGKRNENGRAKKWKWESRKERKSVRCRHPRDLPYIYTYIMFCELISTWTVNAIIS